MPAPAELKRIESATSSMPDWRAGVWSSRSILHGLQMIPDTIANDLATNLIDRVRLKAFFFRLKAEANRRNIGYDKIRVKTEVGLVNLFDHSTSLKRVVSEGVHAIDRKKKVKPAYEPIDFIGAAVQDTERGYVHFEDLAQDHPVLARFLHALGPAAVPLSLGLVDKFVLNTDALSPLFLSISTLVMGGLGAKLKIRNEIEANPIHLRLAAALAYRNGKASVDELTQAIYSINTVGDRARIASDDVMLGDRSREPQRQFLNLERSYLLAEIIRNPDIGLKLMAEYLYNDPVFESVMLKLKSPGKSQTLYRRLRQISLAARVAQTDSKIWRDGNRVVIIQALREMEIPQMLQLLLETSDFDDIHGKADNRKMTDESREMLEKTLRLKPSRVLVDALDVIKLEKPVPADIVELGYRLPEGLLSAAFDLAYDIECSVMDERFQPGGRSVGISSHDSTERATQWRKQISEQAWSAHSKLQSYRREMTFEQQELFFKLLNTLWKKRNSQKSGHTLAQSTLKLLESYAVDSPTALEFLYEHYTNVVLKNLVFDYNHSAEFAAQIDQVVTDVNRSLRKREQSLATTELPMVEGLYGALCDSAESILKNFSQGELEQYITTSLTAKNGNVNIPIQQLKSIEVLLIQLEKRKGISEAVIKRGKDLRAKVARKYGDALKKVQELAGFWIS